jgi:hypothetical protein
MKPITASVVATLFLTGCGPSFPTIDSAALAEAVAQVQKHTVQICSYLPSNNSVVSILTASNPIVETALAIATQICTAVTATVPPLSPAQMQEPKRGEQSQCPMVRGVCIEGQFLQPKTEDKP